MGDLFWTKIAGALLALFLVIMGLRDLAGGLVGPEFPEDLAHPVDLSAVSTGGPAVEEEEGPVDFGLLLASADITAGERVARACVSCHTLVDGGANGTGPNLWGIMGKAVGAADGFRYSGAMSDYGATGAAWSYENMYNYLERPRAYLPGTAMSYAGLRAQEDRINIIAFLRSLSRDPIALPDPLPAEVEAPAEDAGVEAAAADAAAPAEGGVVEAAEGAIDEAAAQLEEAATEVTEAADAATEDGGADEAGDGTDG